MDGIISMNRISEFARENLSPLLIYVTILLVAYCKFNKYVIFTDKKGNVSLSDRNLRKTNS